MKRANEQGMALNPTRNVTSCTSAATWGNARAGCRVSAGQSHYFARSPVVGISDTSATWFAGRG